MPDEYRSIQPRRDPEDFDLAAIKTDLECLMGQVARLPTRKESAFKPLCDDRLCRARYRLVRDFLAALPMRRGEA